MINFDVFEIDLCGNIEHYRLSDYRLPIDSSNSGYVTLHPHVIVV